MTAFQKKAWIFCSVLFSGCFPPKLTQPQQEVNKTDSSSVNAMDDNLITYEPDSDVPVKAIFDPNQEVNLTQNTEDNSLSLNAATEAFEVVGRVLEGEEGALNKIVATEGSESGVHGISHLKGLAEGSDVVHELNSGSHLKGLTEGTELHPLRERSANVASVKRTSKPATTTVDVPRGRTSVITKRPSDLKLPPANPLGIKFTNETFQAFKLKNIKFEHNATQEIFVQDASGVMRPLKLRIIGDANKGGPIAEGASGKFFKIELSNSAGVRQKFALKIIKKPQGVVDPIDILKAAAEEEILMKSGQSQYAANFYGKVELHTGETAFIQEVGLCDLSTLYKGSDTATKRLKAVQSKFAGKLEFGSREHKIGMFQDMADAVNDFHAKDRILTDIKSENFVLMPSGKVKIIDIADSRPVDYKAALTEVESRADNLRNRGVALEPFETRFALGSGTPAYAAPEFLAPTAEKVCKTAPCLFSKQTDTYALGVSYLEIHLGMKVDDIARKLFPDKTLRGNEVNRLVETGDFYQKLPTLLNREDPLNALILDMLKPTEKERLTMPQVKARLLQMK